MKEHIIKPLKHQETERAGKSYMSRVASILVCLSQGISTLTDIANSCKLSKSTVHRLLQSLVESQFAILDPVYHRYYLGGLIHSISMNPQTTHEYLISHALEEMTRLGDVSGETVNLSILVGSLHYSLYEIPSKNDLIITMETMRPRPVYAGGRIKVLFSQLKDADLEIIIKNITLERSTENTVTDKTLFLAQIKQTRQQGYAVSYSERTAGAASISAPIKNYTCPVALSILGFENSLKPKTNQLVKELLISANRLSGSLKQIHTTTK
jgi:DNA-binding IclR family transcriptional regulator